MIGIYGGTFDPVHFGHLRSALELKAFLALDEIRLLPCYQPPHRGTPAATAQQRLEMLERAVRGCPELAIDTREIDRGGPSYMVDTLASLRQELGSRPVLLCIGSDAFQHLTEWHRWRHLFDFAHVVVMTRPGTRLSEPNAFFRERRVRAVGELRASPAGRLFFQPVTALAISATEIRRMIAEGGNPGFLLPEPVIEYILRNKLYRSL